MPAPDIFEGYELAPAVAHPDGSCCLFASVQQARATAQPGDVVHWLVFGRLPDGSVDPLGDRPSEAAAVQLVQRLSGHAVDLAGTRRVVWTRVRDADVRAALASLGRLSGDDALDLDEMVHDAASAMGCNANNGGMAEQVRFLLERGLNIEALVAGLR